MTTGQRRPLVAGNWKMNGLRASAAELARMTQGAGGLAAVTQAETGEAFYSATGETLPFAAEPRTEYGVVTAQQDLRQGLQAHARLRPVTDEPL